VASALVGLIADRISFAAGFGVGAVGAAAGVVALALIERWRSLLDRSGTLALSVRSP
jgi:dipeptide/tripeptide permease